MGALVLRCETVATEHLLLGLAQDTTGVGLLLHQQRVHYRDVYDRLIPGDYEAVRTSTDINFGTEALTLILSASDLVITFKHPKLTNAHLLKALLATQDSINSAIEILHILNVDMDVLHRRVDMILKLTEQNDEPSISVISDSEKAKALPKRVVSDYFSEKTSAVIAVAQSYVRELEYDSIGINHMLVAIGRNEDDLRDYLDEIMECNGVRERMRQPNLLLGGASLNDRLFTEESKDALLAARDLAITLDATVSPSILLFGILCQSNSASLFTDAEQEKLGHIKRSLRTQIVQRINAALYIAEKVDSVSDVQPVQTNLDNEFGELTHGAHFPRVLQVSPRVLRILRFAKDEAILARQQRVEAPHLVLALIKESFFSEIEFVKHKGREVDAIIAAICREQGIERRSSSRSAVDDFKIEFVNFSLAIRRLLTCAQMKASNLRAQCIDLNHIALAVVEQEARLTEIIVNNSYTTVFALERRLEQCSLRQHHMAHASTTESTSPVSLNIFALDDEISESGYVPEPSADVVFLEDRLSQRSERVFGFAVAESRKFGHAQISVEMLLLGLIYETFGATFEVLTLLGVDFHEAKSTLQSCCTRGSERAAALRPLSSNALRLFNRSWAIAQQWDEREINPEHLLLAVAEEHRGVAAFACEALNIDGNLLRSELIAAMRKEKDKKV